MEVLQNAKFIDWLSQYGALHTLKAVNVFLCQDYFPSCRTSLNEGMNFP